MARKRSPHLDDIPSASSNDEREEEIHMEEDPENQDDDDSDDEEQEETKQEKSGSEQNEEDEESEESEDDEDTAQPPPPPPVQKKPAIKKPEPPLESESNEGSVADSGSDSDETQNSPTASAFTVKPIASKPMESASKPKKFTQLKPCAKRPAETEKNSKDSRRKKSKVSKGDEEDGPVEEKKSAINRLWSENDEIAILKGMVDYQLKKGADPYSDMADFHDFIKDLLHVDVSKNQLTDKIRRLKKKYQVNAKKGENGEDPLFSRPHEHKSFELSKKIWGGAVANGVDYNHVKSNNRKDKKSGKVVNNSVSKLMEDAKEIELQEAATEDNKKSGKLINKSVANLMEDVKENVLQEAVTDGVKDERIDFWSMFPYLNKSLQYQKSIYSTLTEEELNLVRENVILIGRDKAYELEQKWKDIHFKQVELFTKRAELIHEQAYAVLNGMNP